MNERIKELAEQAGMMKILEEHAREYGNGMVENTTYPELQQFAELIVQECEKVAKDPKWYGESPSEGWGNPIRHVCKVMKKHFGIE